MSLSYKAITTGMPTAFLFSPHISVDDNMPKLIARSYLSKHPSLRRIIEEIHQPNRKFAAYPK